MNYAFLRTLDHWLGPALLTVLVPLANLMGRFLGSRRQNPGSLSTARRCVFLKLKGGGSLIIAMPALLAMRRAAPETEFALVCTNETKIFAELTGIFNSYYVINDRSLPSLILSALWALKSAFRVDICIDLEHNSILASVFSLLTLATRRLGFVKAEDPYRAGAYTDALSFNVYAPIYIYYDQIAQTLGSTVIPSTHECRKQLLDHISHKQKTTQPLRLIGLAPFTSDFARERMMQADIWINLLQEYVKNTEKFSFVLLGSKKNEVSGEAFAAQLRQNFPSTEVVNTCGKYTLAETAATLINLDEVWTIDSGLLHLARLLGTPCRSYWGPTDPAQRLRSIDDLKEETFYRHFACSPCVHLAGPPPCNGDNLCMKTMADPSPNTKPIWLIGAKS